VILHSFYLVLFNRLNTMVKQKFSIKDLENLSGIKAHTIRIWEKRYGALEPDRTDTNIRLYDITNLQKLLNISFLNDNGYKISRISKMSDEDVIKLVNRISASKSDENRAIAKFKISMINFDEILFESTYQKLLSEKGFRDIFKDVFIPLLEEIGLLWQTKTINPCHEHFITNLIKQKLSIEIEKAQNPNNYDDSKLFVLYLPPNEIHDLGLNYFHYEVLLENYRVINLGSSLPVCDLENILNLHKTIIFATYFTVQPEDIPSYIKEFEDVICKESIKELWVMGRKHQGIDKSGFKNNIKFFDTVSQAILQLQY